MIHPFQPVCLEQQQAYQRRLAKCPQIASDYSFINLWCWAAPYGLEWAWNDDFVWIRQIRPEINFWAPVGDWNRFEASKSRDHFLEPESDDFAVRFIRVPERLVDIWQQIPGAGIQVEEARAQWDYLYSAAALMELRGNRYHKKKNLLRQFQKKYACSFALLDETLIEKTLAMQEKWCQWRDCESIDSLAAENEAIVRLLKNWNAFDQIIGGVLMVDSEIIAFAIAEYLPDETFLVHFEKGDPGFKGVYQAINQIFLEQQPVFITQVNREQDMGDEGLRKAKMSYHPIGFVKKFTVTGPDNF